MRANQVDLIASVSTLALPGGKTGTLRIGNVVFGSEAKCPAATENRIPASQNRVNPLPKDPVTSKSAGFVKIDPDFGSKSDFEVFHPTRACVLVRATS